MLKQQVTMDRQLIDNEPVSDKLGNKVVQGGFWVFGLKLSSRLLSLVSLVVLARLLDPKDFGLLGIALLVISLLEVFSITGFRESLVQMKEETEQYINTAFTIHLLRGIFLYLLLFFAAPLAAYFFKEEGTIVLIRVASLATILKGAGNIRVLYFQKNLKFNQEFIYQFSCTLAQVSSSIVLALIWRNVWALIYGFLISEVVRLVVSYLLIPKMPQLEFDWLKFKRMFSFGKWVLGNSIINFAVLQGDRAFVGRILGATSLGFYQMAFRLANISATEISHVIFQVTFPAYSKMATDLPRLARAYLRVLKVTAFFTFPVAALFFSLAAELTELFLGSKWLAMVPALRVLAISGLMRSIFATGGSLFYGLNKPKLVTIGDGVRLCTLAILIYPLSVYYGLVGVALAVLVSTSSTALVFIYLLLRNLPISVGQYLKVLLIPLLNSSITFFLVVQLKNYLSLPLLPLFILLLLFALIIYCLLSALSDRLFNNQLIDNFKYIIKRKESM